MNSHIQDVRKVTAFWAEEGTLESFIQDKNWRVVVRKKGGATTDVEGDTTLRSLHFFGGDEIGGGWLRGEGVWRRSRARRACWDWKRVWTLVTI